MPMDSKLGIQMYASGIWAAKVSGQIWMDVGLGEAGKSRMWDDSPCTMILIRPSHIIFVKYSFQFIYSSSDKPSVIT
jgi:hypothetical protein